MEDHHVVKDVGHWEKMPSWRIYKEHQRDEASKIYWPITHCHNHLFHLSSLWNLLTIFHYVNTFPMIQCIGLRQISCNLGQSRKHTILLRLVLSGQYVYWEVFGICEKSVEVLFFSLYPLSIWISFLIHSPTCTQSLWDNRHREVHNLKAKSFLQRTQVDLSHSPLPPPPPRKAKLSLN